MNVCYEIWRLKQTTLLQKNRQVLLLPERLSEDFRFQNGIQNIDEF
jgi:hypothetical protein